MEIELRINEVIARYNLDKHGYLEKLAKECGLHRHSVRKFLNGEVDRPFLAKMSALCTYLVNNGVDRTELPGSLFGIRAAELWEAIEAPRKVCLYLGDYEQQHGETVRSWLSVHDAEVLASFVSALSSRSHLAEQRAELTMKYVPFPYFAHQQDYQGEKFIQGVPRARAAYRQMAADATRETVVLVGSQRVNQLAELFVAELFDCEPFDSNPNPGPPFRLTYRTADRAVPSVFGGLENPRGVPGKRIRGIYYRDKPNHWALLPWTEDQKENEDAAIVIVARNTGTNTVTLALLGFSGYATEAVGAHIVAHGEEYWPPEVRSRGKIIGVYAVGITYPKASAGDAPQEPAIKVIPLTAEVLLRSLPDATSAVDPKRRAPPRPHARRRRR